MSFDEWQVVNNDCSHTWAGTRVHLANRQLIDGQQSGLIQDNNKNWITAQGPPAACSPRVLWGANDGVQGMETVRCHSVPALRGQLWYDYWCALSNARKIAQIKDPITWIMMGLGKINNDTLWYKKFGLVLKLFILIIEVKIHKILSTVIEQNLDGWHSLDDCLRLSWHSCPEVRPWPSLTSRGHLSEVRQRLHRVVSLLIGQWMQTRAVIGQRMETLTLTADNLNITCNGKVIWVLVDIADRISGMRGASPGQHDICCKG